MKSSEVIVGIDLGTTNCAACVTATESPDYDSQSISQLVQAGVVGSESLLPSFLYIPHPDEFPADSLSLPWHGGNNSPVIGTLAKNHGGLVPDRLISSAKSWLCNRQVNRKESILPWQSSSVDEKLSPFECTKKLLKHLKGSFEHHMGNSSILDCSVIVTVPASFDEVARNLTFEAAQDAGLGDVLLLEEPLAALYAWIEDNKESWREQLKPGDVILVCDVGGGTTDLSLVSVQDKDGVLELQRISVGEHILLGGDNMDLALAFAAKQQLEESGPALDHWQFLGLVQSCRTAKESLFADPKLEKVSVSAPSRGSNLFAHARSTEITQELLKKIIEEGFFPLTTIDDAPLVTQGSGLQDLGLPYSAEAAVSKHLAAFLKASLDNVNSDPVLKASVSQELLNENHLQPTAVLFNGGVFQAPVLRQRICDLLNFWSNSAQVKELSGVSLSHAVARGAASFGKIRSAGSGLRINAGTNRSYYLGLESSMPAVPGLKMPIKGLCVVEQNTPEGSELPLPNQDFGLVTGSDVSFRFFSSSIRAGDRLGSVIADAESDLDETSNVSMFIEPLEDSPVGEIVPVQLHSNVTELGVLELWMKHKDSSRRWKLEFNVRPGSDERAQ